MSDSFSASDPTNSPTPQELKAALKAFRKRLRLTRLDAESKISGSPLTGRNGRVVAISPPNQFADAVWKELARQGKLKYVGHGSYELVEE